MDHKTSQNFLGIIGDKGRYEAARVAVLSVPYEATVSYGGGTSHGPRAIIEASAQVELYDEELGREPYETGVATLEPVKVAGLATADMSKRVENAVAKIVGDGKMPLVLGGEHSITPPIVRAVHAAHPDITVVQFDAHADLRQEYEGDRMSHACAMARVRETCPVVQLGIRNISIEEAKWAKAGNFPIFYSSGMQGSDRWMAEAMKAIGTEKVYVTIDVDAFDSSIMPATGTPEPGGLSWQQVTGFLKLLSKEKRVVGFDLVELAPIKDLHACDFLVAKLAYKCIGYFCCH